VTPKLGSVGRQGLTDHVYTQLYDNLLSIVLPPGERVNIDAVARAMQVSPTPVREALARMEGEGLVVKRPLAGYVAAPLRSPTELGQLLDVRERIEPWLAGLAADKIRRGHGTVDALKATVRGNGGGSAQSATRERAMQEALAVLAGNEPARDVLLRLHAQFHLYRDALARSVPVPDVLPELRAVVDAIASGRAGSASKAMQAHLDSARTRLGD
jgi:DNA-binding GntR family transcriptional regulator